MRRVSFAEAVEQVLGPAGFRREGRGRWVRVKDGCRDDVSLATVQHLGTTVDISSVDLVSDAIIDAATQPDRPGLMYPINRRIGYLMGGEDIYWRRDECLPEDLAAAVRQYVLPFLERVHTLEGLRTEHSWIANRWVDFTARMHLAITLHRLGEEREACAMLSNPPRLYSQRLVAHVAAVRRALCGEETSKYG